MNPKELIELKEKQLIKIKKGCGKRVEDTDYDCGKYFLAEGLPSKCIDCLDIQIICEAELKALKQMNEACDGEIEELNKLIEIGAMGEKTSERMAKWLDKLIDKTKKEKDKLWRDRINETKNNIIADCDWGTNHGNNNLMAKGSIIKHLDKLQDLETK